MIETRIILAILIIIILFLYWKNYGLNKNLYNITEELNNIKHNTKESKQALILYEHENNLLKERLYHTTNALREMDYQTNSNLMVTDSDGTTKPLEVNDIDDENPYEYNGYNNIDTNKQNVSNNEDANCTVSATDELIFNNGSGMNCISYSTKETAITNNLQNAKRAMNDTEITVMTENIAPPANPVLLAIIENTLNGTIKQTNTNQSKIEEVSTTDSPKDVQLDEFVNSCKEVINKTDSAIDEKLENKDNHVFNNGADVIGASNNDQNGSINDALVGYPDDSDIYLEKSAHNNISESSGTMQSNTDIVESSTSNEISIYMNKLSIMTLADIKSLCKTNGIKLSSNKKQKNRSELIGDLVNMKKNTN